MKFICSVNVCACMCDIYGWLSANSSAIIRQKFCRLIDINFII